MSIRRQLPVRFHLGLRSLHPESAAEVSSRWPGPQPNVAFRHHSSHYHYHQHPCARDWGRLQHWKRCPSTKVRVRNGWIHLQIYTSQVQDSCHSQMLSIFKCLGFLWLHIEILTYDRARGDFLISPNDCDWFSPVVCSNAILVFCRFYHEAKMMRYDPGSVFLREKKTWPKIRRTTGLHVNKKHQILTKTGNITTPKPPPTFLETNHPHTAPHVRLDVHLRHLARYHSHRAGSHGWCDCIKPSPHRCTLQGEYLWPHGSLFHHKESQCDWGETKMPTT